MAIVYPRGIEKLVIISAGKRPKNTRLNSVSSNYEQAA